ncbi:hypothetical protein [Cellulomonas sp.]|uniref:hypothetical protein n=1 Tax=Cellulomonas sp. TaxID=40001 RepID=UPI003BA8E3BD
MQKPVARALALGALFAVVIGAMSIAARSEVEDTTTSGHLWWTTTTVNPQSDTERLTLLLVGIGFFAVALVCAALALRMITRQGSLKQYPAILTGIESMTIQQIAEITGTSTSRVYRDLRALIDSGAVEDFYLDYRSERVVSTKYIPQRSHKTVATCRGCGGNNEVIVGIPRSCSFCGEPVVLPPVHRRDEGRN